MANASAPRSRAAAPPSRLKTGYLILYNFVSAVGWMTVLGRTIALAATRGPEAVYAGVGDWTRWTQTMAALEILHSLFGTPPCIPLPIKAPSRTEIANMQVR